VSDVADALRATNLCSVLDEDQLEWLARAGTVERLDRNARVFAPDEAGRALWVLLEGELLVYRVIQGREVLAVRTGEPGAFAGAVPGAEGYEISARVARPSVLFRIPHDAVREMMDRGFPLIREIVRRVTEGLRKMEALVGHRQKLESLGKVAAELAHEVNNPAAAALRATRDLRAYLERRRARDVESSVVEAAGLLETASSSVHLSVLERADLEEELGAYLRGVGSLDADEAAATLAEAGIAPASLEKYLERAGERRAEALAWLVDALSSRRLLDDIEMSLRRITELVGAVKGYSFMDQAVVGDVDVRKGIADTLVILRHKLAGITLEQSFADDLPLIEGSGGELNQVWVNLLDNAAEALEGRGHISIAGRRDDDEVIVEITDDGPGMPEEVRARIFDPYYTTKDVGAGLGVGLDIVQRVVAAHHGDLSVSSEPGRTRFTVRLPLRQPEGTLAG
jgi:signal transduction histidine kinase